MLPVSSLRDTESEKVARVLAQGEGSRKAYKAGLFFFTGIFSTLFFEWSFLNGLYEHADLRKFENNRHLASLKHSSFNMPFDQELH